jgi:hypothetical protein
MSTPNRPRNTNRRDGWSAERQIGFLDALLRTGSVATAAASVGMSREGAYRLRSRPHCTLFAELWDRIVAPVAAEGHSPALTDGRLARLLGTHFRRQSGEFSMIGTRRAGPLLLNPTGRL